MATWHCDYTSGDDTTGDGSSGTPYKTLQKCVNVATGGDTINIANTSAQVLAAAITWNTGFTADNTKYTIFQAWDNGGSLTIQRPDEATARVAAFINGNDAATFMYSNTSKPEKIVSINLKFYNHNIAGNPYMFWMGNKWGFIGCEFDGENQNMQFCYESGADSTFYINNYFHGCTNPSNNVFYFQDTFFKDNFVEVTANNSARVIFECISVVTNITGNIIKQTGASKVMTTGNYSTIANNTFIASGEANQVCIQSTSGNRQYLYNNVFFEYDGAGSLPMNLSSTPIIISNNGFFNCNASTLPAQIGSTGGDTTASADPFVDAANDDYTLIEAYRGTALASPNSTLDIGAVQSASTGGGGSSEFSFASIA